MASDLASVVRSVDHTLHRWQAVGRIKALPPAEVRPLQSELCQFPVDYPANPQRSVFAADSRPLAPPSSSQGCRENRLSHAALMEIARTASQAGIGDIINQIAEQIRSWSIGSRPGMAILAKTVAFDPVSVGHGSRWAICGYPQPSSKVFNLGESIAVFATPEIASGDPVCMRSVSPETVTNLSMLVQQARRYGCGKQL